MIRLSKLAPKSIERQLLGVLGLSILLLLGILVSLDFAERKSPIQWAESVVTLNRVATMHTVLENVLPENRVNVLRTLSACHDGYTLTKRPFSADYKDARSRTLQDAIAGHVGVASGQVSVGYANVTRNDFSYAECSKSEIDLPMNAIVISTRLQSGEWLNVEVHPYEWHLEELIARILRYSIALIPVGIFALVLIRKISRPLNQLTLAAKEFGQGLKVSPVIESGPPDLRRAIKSFNTMQRQVAEDVRKRTDTLTAISHDLRTPLTALRIRGELVDDEETRLDLIASIDKLDGIIASALEYLRGESRSEPLRMVDLGALLASECSNFEEAGRTATFTGKRDTHFHCRPEALSRAVRNLLDNANKYGEGAVVDLRTDEHGVEISVSDTGPGIPPEKVGEALEPFRRLSKARASQEGGFGLGLAIVDAIVKGHNGELILERNRPAGLIVTIRLPHAPGDIDAR